MEMKFEKVSLVLITKILPNISMIIQIILYFLTVGNISNIVELLNDKLMRSICELKSSTLKLINSMFVETCINYSI